MADEEQNENVDETTPAAEAPEAPEAAAEEQPAEQAAPAEPAAAPKNRREQSRAKRAARSSTTPRTAEERQAERDAARRKKAERRRGARAKSRAKAAEARAASPAVATPPREHGEGRQKTRQGIVVSSKADKTITVRIDVARQHRRYHKIVRSSSTVHAHDEANDAHEGDTVVVRESRPLSRLKRWRLVEVVERAK